MNTEKPSKKKGRGGVEFKAEVEIDLTARKSKKKSSSLRSSEINRKSRMSVYDTHGRIQKKINYAPTYRLESKNPLRLDPIQNVIRSVILQSELSFPSTPKMNPARMANNIADMCAEINGRIKLFNFDRYRLVSYIVLSQKYNQSLSIQLGFMWNSLEDKWTYYVYDHKLYNIIIVVFGIYYD